MRTVPSRRAFASSADPRRPFPHHLRGCAPTRSRIADEHRAVVLGPADDEIRIGHRLADVVELGVSHPLTDECPRVARGAVVRPVETAVGPRVDDIAVTRIDGEGVVVDVRSCRYGECVAAVG